MTNLLFALGAIFYIGLAAAFAVTFIEHRRAASRRAIELADERRLPKAA
jgi:hypothetical protein